MYLIHHYRSNANVNNNVNVLFISLVNWIGRSKNIAFEIFEIWIIWVISMTWDVFNIECKANLNWLRFLQNLFDICPPYYRVDFHITKRSEIWFTLADKFEGQFWPESLFLFLFIINVKERPYLREDWVYVGKTSPTL